MRTLYHYTYSPFSRRARLALAHKGLDCELREARDNPAWLEEAQRLVAFRTFPVLVDDGRAMGDSTAIAHWLDRAYPDAPRLWPDGDDALAVLQAATLVDLTLNTLVDLGTRYFPLRESPAWGGVKQEMLGRAQRAIDALGDLAAVREGRTVARTGWSASDIWLYTMVAWIEGLPARAPTNARVAQVVSLGLVVPSALNQWAARHRDRHDVRALG
jgi:glutathione S-transferase